MHLARKKRPSDPANVIVSLCYKLCYKRPAGRDLVLLGGVTSVHFTSTSLHNDQRIRYPARIGAGSRPATIVVIVRGHRLRTPRAHLTPPRTLEVAERPRRAPRWAYISATRPAVPQCAPPILRDPSLLSRGRAYPPHHGNSTSVRSTTNTSTQLAHARPEGAM